MIAKRPHFLLFSDTHQEGEEGHWRFVLRATASQTEWAVSDMEPEVEGERLQLLGVVRGLEALDRPARVTLVTASRYVAQGIHYGLEEWREADWHWERFGQLVPVKNRDLWQRVARAMKYHQVECRTWRLDTSHRADRPSAVLSGRRAENRCRTRRPQPAGHAGWSNLAWRIFSGWLYQRMPRLRLS